MIWDYVTWPRWLEWTLGLILIVGLAAFLFWLLDLRR